MIKFNVIASGSKGNASIITLDNGSSILIDQGLSLKEFQKRCESAGILVDSIKYIFVTHSHVDHIKSIASYPSDKIFSMYRTLPFYSYNRLDYFLEYEFEEFRVVPVKTSHDAPDPVGYVFYIGDEKLVYITDTGMISKKTLKYLANADIYYFECNHDVDLLETSGRPEQLINRVKGKCGHLSNEQCFTYLNELVGENTKKVYLAHISEDCNNDDAIDLAKERIISNNPYYKNIKFIKCRQWEVTPNE